jgi:putative Holliday junction resolvase
MRLMGLDVGDRRIGVALSDEDGLVAFPLEVINRTSRAKDIGRISALIDQHGVRQVVVGVPRTLAGQIGPQAQKVQDFSERLRAGLPVPVVSWDERLTTAEVEKLLVSADLSRRRRREVVDKLAATLILNSYLNFQRLERST